MSLQIVQNPQQIVDAINQFSSSYHADFFKVRPLGRAYLAEPPSLATVQPLTNSLRDVLARWGAGRREAPTLLSTYQFEATLMQRDLHNTLCKLDANLIVTLNLDKNYYRLIGGMHNKAVLASFDVDLLTVIKELAAGLFSNNTNVTYPMKALMLITGFMPALDSQVRKGLGLGGFVGTNKTQFLIPNKVGSTDEMKISRLPFYIASCFTQNSALISQCIATSRYPALEPEIGRTFDVLFFMQASLMQPILWLQPQNRGWYNIA